jgi:hypothetical protein
LQKTHAQGHPYHLILTWLSKLVEPDKLDSLMQDFKNEKDQHDISQKMERLMAITRPLGWLLHVNQCLSYFDAKNKQGKGIVISGLKDRRNFFQFLSQLEIAWKLKQHGFVVDLEVPTNTKKRIDIVVSKDGLTIDLELATLDMNADLRYSYFATDVPDRAKTIMLNKISNQISHYAKERSNPADVAILLCVSMHRSQEFPMMVDIQTI